MTLTNLTVKEFIESVPNLEWMYIITKSNSIVMDECYLYEYIGNSADVPKEYLDMRILYICSSYGHPAIVV